MEFEPMIPGFEQHKIVRALDRGASVIPEFLPVLLHTSSTLDISLKNGIKQTILIQISRGKIAFGILRCMEMEKTSSYMNENTIELAEVWVLFVWQ
jgi:hypothetical protein